MGTRRTAWRAGKIEGHVRQLRRLGNSYVIAVPAGVVRLLGLEVGDAIAVIGDGRKSEIRMFKEENEE